MSPREPSNPVVGRLVAAINDGDRNPSWRPSRPTRHSPTTAILDCGVLGLTADLRVTVSPLYIGTSKAGGAVDALAGQPLIDVRPGHPSVDIAYISWHTIQVFRSHSQRAA